MFNTIKEPKVYTLLAEIRNYLPNYYVNKTAEINILNILNRLKLNILENIAQSFTEYNSNIKPCIVILSNKFLNNKMLDFLINDYDKKRNINKKQ